MIGIFGGTFDPVHYGHLRSAIEVADVLNLRQVKLIPCSNPAHRKPPVAGGNMRLEMLTMAVQGQANLNVDDREISRPGISYMVDTLKSLKQEYPHEALLLMLGSDSFKYLESWHCWQQLFDFAHVAVITRPGFEIGRLNTFLAERLVHNNTELTKHPAGKLCFQPVTQLSISATAIRQMLSAGKSARFLLPDTVLDYIKQKALYL